MSGERVSKPAVAGNSIHAGRTVTDKIASILLVFSEGSEHSLTEIARRANLPTSTTHRLVTDLAGQGVLERTGTGRLRVGSAVRAIRGSPSPVTVIDRGPFVIDDLCAATGRRVRMGVLSDLDVAYVEKLPGQPAGEGFRRAGRLPASATAVGRALLAFAPPATVERMVLSGLRSYTPRTVVVAHEFRRRLATTRRSHLAITDGEFEPQICGIAMPVFGPTGDVVAALEVSLRHRSQVPDVLGALILACRSLGRELTDSDGRRDPQTTFGYQPSCRDVAIDGHC